MADALADPEVEAQIKKIKTLLEAVKKTQMVFTTTFTSLRPRQRADLVKRIMTDHKTISDFILSSRKFDLRAPSLKFGLENIKQKYQMLLTLWRKAEKLLETTSGLSQSNEGSKPLAPGDSIGSPTGQAVEKYVNALKTLGHDATKEMVDEFKTRLDAAYSQAKTRAGGKDLNIEIVQDGGKIKVRMEPK